MRRRIEDRGPARFVLFAPHAPSPAHLRSVIAEMRRRGPPRLRALWRRTQGAWYALEGSHRAAAAQHLGLVPILERVRLRDEINHDTKSLWPDRRVASVVKFYDTMRLWVRYEFTR